MLKRTEDLPTAISPVAILTNKRAARY